MADKKGLDLVTVRLKKERTLVSDTTVISDEYSAVEFLREELKDYDREVFATININAKGVPVNASIVSIGNLTTTIVHPREVFKSAILSNADGMILMHNHPSGEIKPSREDIETTERLLLAGQIMGIQVLDHIIIGEERSFSFRSNGLVFDDILYDKQRQKEIEKELSEEIEF